MKSQKHSKTTRQTSPFLARRDCQRRLEDLMRAVPSEGRVLPPKPHLSSFTSLDSISDSVKSLSSGFNDDGTQLSPSCDDPIPSSFKHQSDTSRSPSHDGSNLPSSASPATKIPEKVKFSTICEVSYYDQSEPIIKSIPNKKQVADYHADIPFFRCRFCLKGEGIFVDVCECDTDMQYAHADCLQKAIKIDNFMECETCHHEFGNSGVEIVIPRLRNRKRSVIPFYRRLLRYISILRRKNVFATATYIIFFIFVSLVTILIALKIYWYNYTQYLQNRTINKVEVLLPHRM